MTGEWLEDLVADIYTLNGYFCLKSIPGETKDRGGRDEIDIIAIKFGEKKEVVWIECTECISGGVGWVNKKFNDKDKEKYIKRYLKDIYGVDISNMRKIVYANYHHPDIKKTVENTSSIEIRLKADIMKEINDSWKEFRRKYKKISKAVVDEDMLGPPSRMTSIKTFL